MSSGSDSLVGEAVGGTEVVVGDGVALAVAVGVWVEVAVAEAVGSGVLVGVRLGVAVCGTGVMVGGTAVEV